MLVAGCPAPCWGLCCRQRWPRAPTSPSEVEEDAEEDAWGEAVPGWLEAGKGLLAGGQHWDTAATRAECSLQAVTETTGLVLSPDDFGTWL